jgi:small subunit ribosomal protein S1
MTSQPSVTEGAPVSTTDTPAVEVAPDNSTSGTSSGVASPSTAVIEASQPNANGDGGGKRRVRLNPTFDPKQVRPIPTLAPAPAPGTPSPTAAVSPAEEAPSPGLTANETRPVAEAARDDSTPADEIPSEAPARAVSMPAVDVPGGEDLDAEMEAEIAAALDSGEIGVPAAVAVAAAEEASEAPTVITEETLAEGVKVKGTIQTIHADNVFLDLGLRLSGVVPLRQFSPNKPPVAGQTLEVIVSKIDEEEGLIACTLPRKAARISGDWDALAAGQIVECMVTKTNKGGLDVTVSTLKGFMPASQVDLGYIADLEPFVGQKLQCKVTEVNPGRRRLVVSRKAILQEERAAAEKDLLEHIAQGQTLTGRVKTIKDYGAFVDLGGVDGFLHIGQMSWVRIQHPSEVLTEGQDVEVRVLSVDREKKKIGLGMRQLSANPWTTAEAKYAKGSTVTGRVTRTEPFGAFVELEPGVEGLVHISELDHRRVKRVTEVLNVGQTATVQVLEVDPSKKRISLSVKALIARPDAPKDEDLSPGAGQLYERKRKEPLRGGIGGETPGGLFGDPRKYS